MQNLQLDRPLVAFDLETTGTAVDRDRIVEIAMIRVEPDGSRRTFRSLVNPQMPIPPGASKVHGISDDDVADAPVLAALTADILALLEGADLAGYNSVFFDAPLLENELRRVGCDVDLQDRRHLDACTIFKRMEPRTLTAAYAKYCGKELVDAHSALADVEATLAVLDAQVAHYADLPADTAGIHAFCNPDQGRWVDRSRKFYWGDDGRAYFSFGKYRDQSLEQVKAENAGYLEWMLGKDFGADVMTVLREALEGRFPVKS
ncbi:MAG TPA: 3'-5' exonuclease [Candidatus Krumholzibacteria bacterium]|nr:3'-5' exonuclease [Candidatus Krumholzibacteria bacterium]